MNFNTQICTTREQSSRLLALGVKKETADCRWVGCVKDAKGNDIPTKKQIWFTRASSDESAMTCGFMRHDFIPAWSLHRLMELCPKSIHLDDYADTHYYLRTNPTEVLYQRDDKTWLKICDKGNIYDQIIDMIKWLIKNKHFNKEYLEEQK